MKSETRSTKRKEATADKLVNNLFSKHREAVVIYLDRADDSEYNIGVFTKIREDGKLEPLLSEILEQIHNAHLKQCCEFQSEAATGQKKGSGTIT
jgi:hypothetical protein